MHVPVLGWQISRGAQSLSYGLRKLPKHSLNHSYCTVTLIGWACACTSNTLVVLSSMHGTLVCSFFSDCLVIMKNNAVAKAVAPRVCMCGISARTAAANTKNSLAGRFEKALGFSLQTRKLNRLKVKQQAVKRDTTGCPGALWTRNVVLWVLP